MKFYIVVNPASASGRSGKQWKYLEKLFQDSQHEYEVFFSTLSKTTEDICRELTQTDELVRLIVFGGDGSVNEAINGIRDFEKVHFAFIPSGSGNDFARSIGLKQNAQELIEKILEGKVVRTVDIAQVTYHGFVETIDVNTRQHIKAEKDVDETRRFNVSCGIGFDADVSQLALESKLKNLFNRFHIGKLIYLYFTLRVLFFSKRIKSTVSYADGTIEQYSKMLFISCMNHEYEGGGFRFCPNANDSDGMIDACIIDSIPNHKLLRLIPYTFSGKHTKFQGVYLRKSEKISIELDQPHWIHTDGEVLHKSQSITVSLYQQKLQMMI